MKMLKAYKPFPINNVFKGKVTSKQKHIDTIMILFKNDIPSYQGKMHIKVNFQQLEEI